MSPMIYYEYINVLYLFEEKLFTDQKFCRIKKDNKKMEMLYLTFN